MKKIALLICSIMMMLACLSQINVLATEGNSVKIRVEGISNTLASTANGYTTQAATALDAVKELLDAKSIPYVLSSGYLSSINGESAGTFGGYDGWMFFVNGVMPDVGADTYQVQNDDEIVFFYGGFPPETLIPRVMYMHPINPGEQVQVTISSTYFDWGDYTEKTIRVAGVKVRLNGVDYTTNSSGTVTFTAPPLGNYDMEISKTAANGFPLIVRNKLTISVVNAIKVRVEGINSTLAKTDVGYFSQAATALDAVKELLDANSIPYVLSSGYLSSINGESAGTFGGYDGWMYFVNGAMPDVGSDAYQVQNGDDIVFFYGGFPPETLIPKITMPQSVRAGKQFTVNIQSTYFDWGDYTEKTVNVEGVKVSIK